MALEGKRKIFADEYGISHNATEAAKKAGYSEKTAYSQGHRLLKDAEIKKYIDERDKELDNGRIATATEILEFFTEVMTKASLPIKDRLKAGEYLAKHRGLFVERPDDDSNTRELTVRHVDASMTEAEVERELEENYADTANGNKL